VGPRDQTRWVSAYGPSRSGRHPFVDRNGHDWAPRYPLIIDAVNALKVRSCLIDGGAVVCDEDGRAVFERLRKVRRSRQVLLCASICLELDGKDPSREPLEVRKATLASLLRARLPGLQFNQHLTHPGDIVLRHACAMGLEGIVSKRLGSRYVSGRTRDWLKFKNPEAPAVKREAEEDRAGDKERAPPVRTGLRYLPEENLPTKVPYKNPQITAQGKL